MITLVHMLFREVFVRRPYQQCSSLACRKPFCAGGFYFVEGRQACPLLASSATLARMIAPIRRSSCMSWRSQAVFAIACWACRVTCWHRVGVVFLLCHSLVSKQPETARSRMQNRTSNTYRKTVKPWPKYELKTIKRLGIVLEISCSPQKRNENDAVRNCHIRVVASLASCGR